MSYLPVPFSNKIYRNWRKLNSTLNIDESTKLQNDHYSEWIGYIKSYQPLLNVTWIWHSCAEFHLCFNRLQREPPYLCMQLKSMHYEDSITADWMGTLVFTDNIWSDHSSVGWNTDIHLQTCFRYSGKKMNETHPCPARKPILEGLTLSLNTTISILWHLLAGGPGKHSSTTHHCGPISAELPFLRCSLMDRGRKNCRWRSSGLLGCSVNDFIKVKKTSLERQVCCSTAIYLHLWLII